MKRVVFLAALTLAAQSKLAPIDQTGFAKMIAAHHGKVVLVDFWATWCKPCRAQTPLLVTLAGKLRSRGLDFVTVSLDEPTDEAAALKVLAEDHVSGVAYIKHVADDDQFYQAINPDWIGAAPAMFLYDRNGRMAKAFIGETPVKDIQAAIEKIL